MKTPDICTGLCEPPQNHCWVCSHAYFIGELNVPGRYKRFEFNPQWGPVWIRKDGEPMKSQPDPEKYVAVWDEWEKWYARF